MTNANHEAAVLDFVRTQVSTRTGVPMDQIDASSGLIAMGLQSIDAVLLCAEVEEHFQVELDPSTIFEHDTLGSFVADVVSRIDGQ